MADDNLEIDAVLGSVFALGSAHTLGIGDFELLGVSLSETFYTLAGIDVAWASLLSLVGLLGVVAANSPSWDRMGDEAKILGLATGAVVLVGAYDPSIIDPITLTGGSATIAAVAWAIEAGGFWALATSR
jgi:hypothetical protein